MKPSTMIDLISCKRETAGISERLINKRRKKAQLDGLGRKSKEKRNKYWQVGRKHDLAEGGEDGNLLLINQPIGRMNTVLYVRNL